MEITIKATPEELAKMLQTIVSSKEQTKRKHPESKIEYDPQTGEGILSDNEQLKFTGGLKIAGKHV